GRRVRDADQVFPVAESVALGVSRRQGRFGGGKQANPLRHWRPFAASKRRPSPIASSSSTRERGSFTTSSSRTSIAKILFLTFSWPVEPKPLPRLRFVTSGFAVIVATSRS